MNSGIYKITCIPTGKVYIGQSVELKYRIRSHFRKLRLNNHENPHMQRAFNKYGECNFAFEIVEFCDEDVLDEREDHFIRHFNSMDSNNGFNQRTGGSHGRWSDEIKAKMRESQLRNPRVMTDELRRKMSDSRKGRPAYNKGKKMPEHQRIGIIERRRGGWLGNKNPNYRVTEKIAKEIVSMLVQGMTIDSICERFDLGRSTVQKIRGKETWTHLTKDITFPEVYASPNPGEKNGMSKITEDDAKAIIGLLMEGLTIRSVSEKLNIPEPTVEGIRGKSRWSYLTEGISFPESQKRYAKGENNGSCKITTDTAKRIIESLLQGRRTTSISEEFGVTEVTINAIKHKKTWTHLTENISFPDLRKQRARK